MKVSPKPLIVLATAAFCAAMLAFTPNASAVTDLTASDEHYLGLAALSLSPPSYPTDIVNRLISMPVNSVVLGYEGFDLFRSGNDFGSLPTAVLALNGTGANITIGSGLYSYLLADYTANNLFHAHVWYIGNLSGNITIPAGGLIGWTLFGPGVPDGGTTVSMLGCALLGLAALR